MSNTHTHMHTNKREKPQIESDPWYRIAVVE